MCHHLISIFMILYMFSLGGPPMSTMGAPPSTNTYGAPMTGNLGAPVPPAGPSAGGSTDYASAMYNMMKPPSAGDIVGVKGPLPPGSNPNPSQGLANDPNLQGGGGTGGAVAAQATARPAPAPNSALDSSAWRPRPSSPRLSSEPPGSGSSAAGSASRCSRRRHILSAHQRP